MVLFTYSNISKSKQSVVFYRNFNYGVFLLQLIMIHVMISTVTIHMPIALSKAVSPCANVPMRVPLTSDRSVALMARHTTMPAILKNTPAALVHISALNIKDLVQINALPIISARSPIQNVQCVVVGHSVTARKDVTPL